MAHALPHSPLPNKHILVVDDDPSIRLLCSRTLQQAGYAVLEAEGSSEAMAIYTAWAQPIDLLLLDLFLPPPAFQMRSDRTSYPRVNGHELVCQALPLKRPLRVLYISSHPYDSLASQGMAIAPEQFLPKPFSTAALLTQVAAVLAAPPIPHLDTPARVSMHTDVPWVD